MSNQNQIQPIFILPEGTQRNTGRNAQRNNIMAAKLVAETVRTTLGPKGMDKMLVDSIGDVTITNDGVTILKEMQIEHPAAKMLVEISKTQENEVGDGTTTVVVLAGEFLKKAEGLLEQDIHPTVIARGYQLAADKSIEILNTLSQKCTEKDKELLKKIAMTAMTGKGAESSKEKLSDIIVKAILLVGEKEKPNSPLTIDIDDIKLEKKVGGSIEDTELIEGIVLDKEKVHPSMPKKVINAKIALIQSAIEIKETETDSKISITDPEKLQGFLDMEEKMLKKMVDKIEQSGANVVFCQKGIDDVAQHFLAKKGILAVRRVKESDMERLAKATGASMITSLDDLTPKELGNAGIIEEIKIGDEEMMYIKDCKGAKSVTILISGGSEHIIDEVRRALEDSIGDIVATLKNGKVVAGAGSTELELSIQLKSFANTLKGREQLAVMAFAESLEIIPKTLAENAGLDPIDVIAELKALHDNGQKWAGINVFSGKAMDAWKEGVIEPLKIKTQAVSSASEVAVMLLRIDDVIAAGPSGPQPGMPPGMGGMGGMPEM